MGYLEKAIIKAAMVHENQKDKAGEAYIFHVLRVMMNVNTEDEKIVALLHDVIEDSDVSAEELKKEGYPPHVTDAIECMTKNPDEPYETYIQRVKTNPISRKVKLADLEDNMNVKRMHNLSDWDIERLRKYHRAWIELS